MKRDISAYIIQHDKNLSLGLQLRDLMLTLIAWLLWIWLCWDFVHLVHLEVANRLSENSKREIAHWPVMIEEISLSLEASGLIITVLFISGILNFTSIRKIKLTEPVTSKPLTDKRQAAYFNCTPEELASWRNTSINEIEISDTGAILTHTSMNKTE